MCLRRRIFANSLFGLLFLQFGSPLSLGQSSHALHADRIEAQILKTTPNPDDPKELVVTIRVTVYAGDRTLVIPDCAEKQIGPKWLCSAQLARKNGRGIGVRKHLLATLGQDVNAPWRPISVLPGNQESFMFTFDGLLMDVRPGELVKIKFQTWPDTQSVKDWKIATTLLSPAFQVPTNGQ